MSVHFLSSELGKWDEASAGALVLTFFVDERPLRGAAGLADWRLCGALSRLIKSQRVLGEGEEALMMPPGRRLPFERIMIFGLGRADDFSEETYREHVQRIRRVLAKAKVKTYAVQPPGRATGLIAARRALEIWMEESERDTYSDEVAIVDTPGAQKEMADILHAYQRRATQAKSKAKRGKGKKKADRAEVADKPAVAAKVADKPAVAAKVADKPAAAAKVADKPAVAAKVADKPAVGEPAAKGVDDSAIVRAIEHAIDFSDEESAEFEMTIEPAKDVDYEARGLGPVVAPVPLVDDKD